MSESSPASTRKIDRTPLAEEGKPTPRFAWVALISTLIVSIIVPMAWFSIPPNAGLIFGSFAMKGTPIDPTQFGLLMNGLSYSAMIIALPCGFIIRKIGIKPTLLIACGLVFLGALWIALLADLGYEYLLTGRIIQGFGVGMTSVTGPTAVAIWFSNKRRGLAIAIWSCWVPIGMLTVFNVSPQIAQQPESLGIIWWMIVVLLAVAFVQFAIVYRIPRKEETTEITLEPLKYREALPYLKNRQFIALLIAWLLFEYINYGFTTFDVTFLQEGFGVDPVTAALVGSIASACGILAPISGAILDKLKWSRKWILVAIGCCALAICTVFGFKAASIYLFAAYFFWHVIGNVMLVGSCRPMVPFLLGRGGSTVVAVALSFLTFFQYLGETLETFFTLAIGAWGYEMASWVALTPFAVIATVFAFFVRPSKAEKERVDAELAARNARITGECNE
ncbi:MAG: MFS transporter [Coriobacteriales bacterium]|jgi:MFS family permease|nr:MFS transporter [Coriobacteriales bacterium]